jgi:putative inorganic carbon (HCO3(-)) transporter
MRDLIIFLIVVSAIPLILWRAWTGILVWSWLSFMNPHRLAWGFAYAFPFAQLVAIVTFIAILFDRSPKRLPMTPVMLAWLGLILWMNVTTLTAVYPEAAAWEWNRTMKIMLFAVLTIVLINTRQKINALCWVLALSLGFFGLKGGFFSLLGGGENLVFGPPGSFFEDNNALGLALVMILPLMFYLTTTNPRRSLRYPMFVLMGFTGLSVLGTHSRGALLAGVAMVGMLWLKNRYKIRTALALLALLPALLFFMPDEWWERMQSIRDFRQDSSAMGRINSWGFAIRLALDKPLVGGGFQVFKPELFLSYAPNPTDFHDSHSIYFEILAEHGFVGLGLFLALGALTLLAAGRVVRQSSNHDELRWARDLASMMQVALVGYAVGGAFLGLAYFDLYYQMIAIVVILQVLVRQHLLGEKQSPTATTAVKHSSAKALSTCQLPHQAPSAQRPATRSPQGANA